MLTTLKRGLFETFSDYLVAAVVATEVPPAARGDFTEEMRQKAIRAVCNVIRNRVKAPAFPDTPAEVVLQRKAFSAVYLSQVRDEEDYWIRACAGRWFPDHVRECLKAWRRFGPDITNGATHYYSPVSMKPKYREPDWWDEVEEVLIPGLSGDYFRFGRAEG